MDPPGKPPGPSPGAKPVSVPLRAGQVPVRKTVIGGFWAPPATGEGSEDPGGFPRPSIDDEDSATTLHLPDSAVTQAIANPLAPRPAAGRVPSDRPSPGEWPIVQQPAARSSQPSQPSQPSHDSQPSHADRLTPDPLWSGHSPSTATATATSSPSPWLPPTRHPSDQSADTDADNRSAVGPAHGARWEIAGSTAAQPSQAQPSQAQPSQAQPSQAQPAQAQPSQAQPSQAQPSQAQPAQAQPSGPGFGQHHSFHAGRAYPNLPSAAPYAPTSIRFEPAPVVRMNKWSYRLVMFGGAIISGALGAWGANDRAVQELLVFFWIPAVPAVLMALVLVHKMWQAVQDAHVRTSPARAVALLFVPIFAFYWIFEVFPGFATDYNAYIARHRIGTPRLSRSVCLAALLPVVGLVFLWIAIGRICDGVNALSAHQ